MQSLYRNLVSGDTKNKLVSLNCALYLCCTQCCFHSPPLGESLSLLPPHPRVFHQGLSNSCHVDKKRCWIAGLYSPLPHPTTTLAHTHAHTHTHNSDHAKGELNTVSERAALRFGAIVPYCHIAVLLYCRIAILPYCHIAVLPCCRIAILPYCHIAVLPCCRIAVLPYCRIAILPYCHVAVLPYCRIAILPYCHFAVLPHTNTRTHFSVQLASTFSNI